MTEENKALAAYDALHDYLKAIDKSKPFDGLATLHEMAAAHGMDIYDTTVSCDFIGIEQSLMKFDGDLRTELFYLQFMAGPGENDRVTLRLALTRGDEELGEFELEEIKGPVSA